MLTFENPPIYTGVQSILPLLFKRKFAGKTYSEVALVSLWLCVRRDDESNVFRFLFLSVFRAEKFRIEAVVFNVRGSYHSLPYFKWSPALLQVIITVIKK